MIKESRLLEADRPFLWHWVRRPPAVTVTLFHALLQSWNACWLQLRMCRQASHQLLQRPWGLALNLQIAAVQRAGSVCMCCMLATGGWYHGCYFSPSQSASIHTHCSCQNSTHTENPTLGGSNRGPYALYPSRPQRRLESVSNIANININIATPHATLPSCTQRSATITSSINPKQICRYWSGAASSLLQAAERVGHFLCTWLKRASTCRHHLGIRV